MGNGSSQSNVNVKPQIKQTQAIGHFIDDPTLLSTLMIDTTSSQPQSPKVWIYLLQKVVIEYLIFWSAFLYTVEMIELRYLWNYLQWNQWLLYLNSTLLSQVGKTGIPALPDPISLPSNEKTGEADCRGRIMIPGIGGLVAVVAQPQMAATVDTQKRQFGLWLSRQILPLQALPLITKDNKIDILIQLDIKVLFYIFKV